MKTHHVDVIEVATELKEVIKSLNLFKNVEICYASSWSQIIRTASKIVGAPKAILCIGAGQYEEQSLIRNFQISIIMISNFGDNFFDKINALENVFMIDFNDEGLPVYAHTKTGAKITLSDWTLADTDDKNTYAILTIDAQTYAQK